MKLDGIWYGFAARTTHSCFLVKQGSKSAIQHVGGHLVARQEGVCGDNLLRAGRGCVGTTCHAPVGGVVVARQEGVGGGQLVARREGVCGDNVLRAGRGCVGTTEITE